MTLMSLHTFIKNFQHYRTKIDHQEFPALPY
jgi:hypothetical protein